MSTIAFLGLGRMGSAMARKLLESGHELRVFNRTRDRAKGLIALGARGSTSPREACNGVDAIISMVSDDQASRFMWQGPEGALSAVLPSGALAIECSTLSYDWVLQLGAAVSERGLRYIDAPVTGLPENAAAGGLTLLLGTDPQHLPAAQSVLSALCCRTIHFGPVGAGTAYKLLVNMLGAVQIASLAEAMALAERIGLDLAMVADAIGTGQAGSPQVARNARRMAEGRHHERVVFTPQLRFKDVDYALKLAGRCGLGSPFGALAGDMFGALCALNGDTVNESKVIDIARAAPLDPAAQEHS